jgi:endonuclease IV
VRRTAKKIFAVSLDVAGVLAAAYGVFENNNVRVIVNDVKKIEGKEYIKGSKADESVNRRNIAYIAGAALLASGITVHIVF